MNAALRLTLALLGIFPCSILAQTLHWNKGRGYATFKNATPQGVLISNHTGIPLIDSVALATPLNTARLRFRIDNRHASPLKNYRYTSSDGSRHTCKNPPWALFLSDRAGKTCWLTISRSPAPADDLAEDSSGTTLSISLGSYASSHSVKDRVVPFSGESLWTVELADGHLRVIAGANEPAEIAAIPLSLDALTSFGFVASPASEILLSDISAAPTASAVLTHPAVSYAEEISESPLPTSGEPLSASDSDPLEGTYEIFDRTLDESLLRLGGEYRLAVVRNHGRYDIIYINGARINAGRWKPGMLKGILTPTAFDGIYNLEWFDAEGRSLSHSITAQSGYGGILTLQFPYHSSTIRLRKTD